jgi:hypothetical protein
MKNLSKNHNLCEDVIAEPEKFAPRGNDLPSNDSFRMIEIKKTSNGRVSVEAIIIQKPMHS